MCKSQKQNPSFGKKEIPVKRDKLSQILTFKMASKCLLICLI